MRCHLGPRGKKPSLEVALGSLRIPADTQGCAAWVEEAAVCEGGLHSFSGVPARRTMSPHVQKEKHDFQ